MYKKGNTSNEEKRTGWDLLPPEIVQHILIQLPYRGLISKCPTSLQVATFCRSENFWQGYAREWQLGDKHENETWKVFVTEASVVEIPGGTYYYHDHELVWKGRWLIPNNAGSITDKEVANIGNGIRSFLIVSDNPFIRRWPGIKIGEIAVRKNGSLRIYSSGEIRTIEDAEDVLDVMTRYLTSSCNIDIIPDSYKLGAYNCQG